MIFKAIAIAFATYKAERLRQRQRKIQLRHQVLTARLKQAKAHTNEAQNKVAALIMEYGAE